MLKRGERIPDEILVAIMVEKIRYENGSVRSTVFESWSVSLVLGQVLPLFLTMVTKLVW